MIKLKTRKSMSRKRKILRNKVLSRKELIEKYKLSEANQIEMK